MSAADRVAQAAKTIRARWEQRVVSDPQTEAAQALEDAGQLLDPEVAAELAAFRKARELAAAVAEHGAFPVPVGPQPLTARQKVDEAFGIEARLFQHALDKVFSVLTEGGFLAAPSQIATLRARIAELESERHETNEALDDAVQALRANAELALPWAASMDDGDLHGFLGDLVSAAMGRWQSDPEVPDRVVLAAVEKACAAWRTPGEGFRSDPEPDECTCPPVDQPGPHQLGCPQAEVPPVAAPLKGVARLNASAAAAAEATHWKRLGIEDPHDGPLARSFRLGHDLPEMGGPR